MNGEIKAEQKATIVSNIDRISSAVLSIEKELGMVGDPTVMDTDAVSSDKINGVICVLDSISARLNDVLASVSGIG